MTDHLLTPAGLKWPRRPSCLYATVGRRGSTCRSVSEPRQLAARRARVCVRLCVCEYSALTLNHCSSRYVMCFIYRVHKQTNEQMRSEKADKAADLQAGPDMPGI